MQSTCLLDGSQRTVSFNSVTLYCTLYIMIQIHSQLDFHLERGESPPLCNSRRRNHEVWSNREEGSGHCSICKSFSVSKCLPLTSRQNLRILCIKKKKIQYLCIEMTYSLRAFAKLSTFCSSKFVVGSSKARIPQFRQKVSASAKRIKMDARTCKTEVVRVTTNNGTTTKSIMLEIDKDQ